MTLDDIVKLSPLKKILILIAIIAVISAGYYFPFYTSKQQEKSQLQDKLERLQLDLRKKQNTAKKLDRYKKEVAQLNEDFTRALIQLPDKKEIPSLLSNISRLGKEAGLEFLLFKPKGEVAKDFYAEIPIDIKVSGSFHKVAIFFDKVSKLPRIVNVTNLDMGSPKVSDNEILLTTSCLATTFKFIERKENGEPAKKKKKKK
ncbi:MAG: type 4a pilus biogenesis protein PilO [Thermodesulfobacteriota bacterium]|nr:type 4a pilus biogenesis protein PilO [Thermodesulfobacteriota bacterium]